MLRGSEAQNFLKKELDDNVAVFEFLKVSDAKVDEFFMEKFNSSDKTPTEGEYVNDDNARVIDEYKILENNCTTISIEAINSSGGNVPSSISPHGLLQSLIKRIVWDKIMSIFGKDREIIHIQP